MVTTIQKFREDRGELNSDPFIVLVDEAHRTQEGDFGRRMREALKDDGRLVLLEFRKEDTSVPIRLEHKMSIAEVKMELEPEGFRVDKVLDVLPWQHIFICKKKD